jgi:hypothetical protein
MFAKNSWLTGSHKKSTEVLFLSAVGTDETLSRFSNYSVNLLSF